MDPKTISLLSIVRDGGTQSRAAINNSTVEEYAQALEDGAKFPPVVVFFDGKKYHLADGFHRCAAFERARIYEFEADIHQGTQRDAVLFSVGANARHGLRRTNADKRRAVEILLNDREWVHWSDREIARQCAVSQPFVSSMRNGLTDNIISENAPDERTYTTKHGTKSTMNTAHIGAKAAPEEQDAGLETGAKETPRPSAEAHTAPRDPNAKRRKELEKLTPEALIEDVIGLQDENEELRVKLTKQTSEIAGLKGRIDELSQSNQGAVISRLQELLNAANYKRDEALAATKRMEYSLKKTQSERDDAKASQVIVF